LTIINVDLSRRQPHDAGVEHDDQPDAARSLLAARWADLAGPPELADEVEIVGPAGVLPSVFDVTGFATACAGAAAAAVAELAAARTSTSRRRASVDRMAASASFRFEGLIAPDGWELPPIWDPVAGDYRTADGWIRLHTNYRHHLEAVVEVLGVPAEREAVAAAVAGSAGDELEAAVVAAGGAAAAMRTGDAWAAHLAGLATAGERPVVLGAPVPISGGTGPDLAAPAGSAPLTGIRVLDLTRVIAGPVATRYLAAYGADVVRIDPPGFEEVPALLPEATAGKRCAWLDLRTDGGRDRFLALVAEAHVVVGGLRPGALAGLGLGLAELRAANPAVITVTHDAYGWDGPWAGRRGFDSLVQMSTGIAAAGAAAAGTDRPTPLPAQALDHGVGHLLAAATCRALTRLAADGATSDVRGSLVGASNVLRATTAPATRSTVTVADAQTEVVDTAWGPMRHAPLAGQVEGIPPRWAIDAGPLGRHAPSFAP
jgi:crotonobetainyl-CoA:carnitine CoA-transferase CaiB-like acyl-CoA transferase